MTSISFYVRDSMENAQARSRLKSLLDVMPQPHKERIKKIRQAVLRQLGYFSRKRLEVYDSLLIVSPHPDDEILGCGGLLARRCAAGKPSHVLFLTSGEASHSKCCGLSKEVVGSVRRELAIKAHAVLGNSVDRLCFLDGRDGSLPRANSVNFSEFTGQIALYMELLRPQAVFCPHPFGVFNDHVACEELVRAAMGRLSHRSDLFHYCVWFWYSMPLYKAMRLRWREAYLLDITAQSPAKREALGIYLNQKAPCGQPWVGGLPAVFLEAFYWEKELFFKSATLQI